jgi:biotin operon repressor
MTIDEMAWLFSDLLKNRAILSIPIADFWRYIFLPFVPKMCILSVTKGEIIMVAVSNRKRINLALAPNVAERLEALSDQLGISRTSAIALAITTLADEKLKKETVKNG